MKRQCHVIEKD